jgi:hypothetical protein
MEKRRKAKKSMEKPGKAWKSVEKHGKATKSIKIWKSREKHGKAKKNMEKSGKAYIQAVCLVLCKGLLGRERIIVGGALAARLGRGALAFGLDTET